MAKQFRGHFERQNDKISFPAGGQPLPIGLSSRQMSYLMYFGYKFRLKMSLGRPTASFLLPHLAPSEGGIVKNYTLEKVAQRIRGLAYGSLVGPTA